MSAIIKVFSGGKSNKAYFIYNFKQVDNLVMIILFDDVEDRWIKITATYDDRKWEMDGLNDHISSKIVTQLYRTLEDIFNEHSDPRIESNIETELSIQHEAEFLLNQ